MLMDNSSIGESAGYNNAPVSSPEQVSGFESSNAEIGTEVTNEVDARANNNAETQRMRGELQDMFAQQEAQAAEQTVDIGEKEELRPESFRKLEQVNVPRNASSMPSAFASEARTLLNNSMKDGGPYEFCNTLDLVRQEYIEKAFDRKRGQGLTGQ